MIIKSEEDNMALSHDVCIRTFGDSRSYSCGVHYNPLGLEVNR